MSINCFFLKVKKLYAVNKKSLLFSCASYKKKKARLMNNISFTDFLHCIPIYNKKTLSKANYIK